MASKAFIVDLVFDRADQSCQSTQGNKSSGTDSDKKCTDKTTFRYYAQTKLKRKNQQLKMEK